MVFHTDNFEDTSNFKTKLLMVQKGLFEVVQMSQKTNN